MWDKGLIFLHAQFNQKCLMTKNWKQLLKLNQLTNVSLINSMVHHFYTLHQLWEGLFKKSTWLESYDSIKIIHVAEYWKQLLKLNQFKKYHLPIGTLV